MTKNALPLNAKRIYSLIINIPKSLKAYWAKNRWHKLIVVVAIGLIALLGGMYAIARWYIYTESRQPLILGVSFIPDYAQSLGLNPEQTMQAIIKDLGVKQFRLTSYWSDIESQPGVYNFSQLDWEFQQVNAVHGKVSLAIGLRQPRWPECHAPPWAAKEPISKWQPQLEQFIAMVVNHFKHNPALSSYQLENEYFNPSFGSCTNYSRSRLIAEAALVKKLDPNHTLIISRSNNDLGIPIGQPQPNEFGVSVYKRVWSPIIGRYFEYPIPAWYYGFSAGVTKIVTGKNTIIHELQAEPWTPHGLPITQTSLKEQNKSMNAKRLKSRFNYGEATGMKTIYLWGAEYWYYRMVKLHDNSMWNTARQEFAKTK